MKYSPWANWAIFRTPRMTARPMATKPNMPPVTTVFTRMYGPWSQVANANRMTDTATVIPPALFNHSKIF